MKPYEDLNEWERMKHDEIVLDARDEEEALRKEAEEEAARPAPEPVPADAEHTGDESCRICQGCEREFIDGSYTNCGCCECEADEAQRRAERPEAYEDESAGAW
jgi:hypothetical protein